MIEDRVDKIKREAIHLSKSLNMLGPLFPGLEHESMLLAYGYMIAAGCANESQLEMDIDLVSDVAREAFAGIDDLNDEMDGVGNN